MTAPITLYQFELCPFCHKVKAGLEVKGLAYDKVEVNPMNKKELPPGLPEDAPRKVPVLRFADGEIVYDSTDILNALEARHPERPFTPADADRKARSDAVEAWVDETFAQALPTVIYGTWGEALRAAQVTARTSNFGFVQNVGVRAGGSLIMHQISKKILKRNGRGPKEGRAWVREEVERFEGWLAGDDFIGGAEPSLGDVAMHGALTCVQDFPIFAELMERPVLQAWYDRVRARRVV